MSLRVVAFTPAQAQRLSGLTRTRDDAPRAVGADRSRAMRMYRPVSQELIAGRAYQWRYMLRRVRFDLAAEVYADVAGVADLVAYNAFEAANTASIVAPGYVVSSLIAAGWDVYPVGVTRLGSRIDCVFPAWPMSDDEGGRVLEFSVQNPIDGVCPE